MVSRPIARAIASAFTRDIADAGPPSGAADWEPILLHHYDPSTAETNQLQDLVGTAHLTSPKTGTDLIAAGESTGHPTLQCLNLRSGGLGFSATPAPLTSIGDVCIVVAHRAQTVTGTVNRELLFRSSSNNNIAVRFVAGDVTISAHNRAVTFTGAVALDTAGWHVAAALVRSSTGEARFSFDGDEKIGTSNDGALAASTLQNLMSSPTSTPSFRSSVGEFLFLDANADGFSFSKHAGAAADYLIEKWL
jgi:hypothetical protein